MKTGSIFYIAILALFALVSCREESPAAHDQENSEGHAHEEEDQHEEMEEVHLSPAQMEALEIESAPLQKRNIASVVQANGELEVPPQNEAIVTAVVGGNVSSIKVIEGDRVRKGQPLVYLTHPDITEMQADYLEQKSRLAWLEKEYERQKNLVEAGVGAGKDLERASAEYAALKESLGGKRMQLRQIGIDPGRLSMNDLYSAIPVYSPIDGYITVVDIKTGQYVQPNDVLFEVINTHHIHADLMVFERDVFRVREGQKIRFRVETLPGKELNATIYSVGKKFESDPKAVHVHAEIENKEGLLIPGMYIQGRILTDSVETLALPEAAIVREGDRYFAFAVVKAGGAENEEEWVFRPVEVKTGISSDDWVEIRLLDGSAAGQPFALNNAYYLMAEMKKGEGGHGHGH